ncbi:amidase domain-containing protein [Caldibacillus lycopersici]|uniref:Amidase domain-containing protein n=1 Tax=Perspicuibacillus lycopersici TaxID=1325689 RepID=A0AAE3LMC7_9BACI|nr:amidase domain-containing protein [Perspicuibacillus lycopersici]MCU9612806.1 amidase domain-containing protein [Perspicuibacillus lycopersici]
MIQQLQSLLERRVNHCISDQDSGCLKIEKKKTMLHKRSGEIIKAKATGKIINRLEKDEQSTDVLYDVHFTYVIKQRDQFYIEEELEHRKATFYKEELMTDDEIPIIESQEKVTFPLEWQQDMERVSYHYDRLKAVQYAERWWNDYNPQYKKFPVDCTSFISQCLHAGGAPMRGYPNRGSGWWYRDNNWSYSWSVAHSLRWYLGTSKVGLRANEVQDPRELQLGDVICYDFQGDGRFDHSTIVTAKDANGMPLVNAHTTNSRMRYWSYEDSSAYTDNINYKFFTIVDDQ